jgi:hypothetical protein
MKYPRKFIFVLTLWILFAIGCFAAPFLVIVYPYFKKHGYTRNIVKAADRMCAALLGFTGRQMLSTELIQGTRLIWMREELDEIQPRHCEESAYEEGAYCRLTDHQIGTK